ncbi:MAG: DUF29 domain-containing protein [Proteobacteria bacterium]|nr:DUF29 domain-containing protein [Pseudomonadota bacterium]
MPDDRLPQSTYDQDFDIWTLSQAAALRAVGAAVARGEVTPDARLLALDWDNLAEEIESLGRRDRRELSTRLALIMEHLLKLEFSHHADPRQGWIVTVRRERRQITMLVNDSPSLRRLIPVLIHSEGQGAFEDAIAALAAHGEKIDASSRLARHYTEDEVLGPWLPDLPTS